VLFIHGGNWIGGDKGDYQEFVDALGADSGWVTANMNYRTLFQFAYCGDMLDDIEAALTQLLAHAKNLGVDIKKVALAGHSAGGHLALLYSYKEQAHSPIPIALAASLAGPADLSDPNMYDAKLGSTSPNVPGISFSIGVTFLTKIMEVTPTYIGQYESNDFAELQNIFMAVIGNNGVWYSSNGGPNMGAGPAGSLTDSAIVAAIDEVSPAHYVTANVPPTMLFHGYNDTTVRPSNSELLENALNTVKVEVGRQTYPTDHEFGRGKSDGTDVWTGITAALTAKLKTIPAE
jgi:acetyl esterase/lipase